MNKRFTFTELIILIIVCSLLFSSAINYYQNSQRITQETLVNENIKEAMDLIETDPDLAKKKLHEIDKTITYINGRCLINA